MPGSFGDDLEFAATLGAGLKAAGFDDNIAVDDPQYRRRDSPPGSNDELGDVSRDVPSVVASPPEEDEWGTSLKGKKKKKKARKGKQETPMEPEPASTPAEERSSEPIEIVEPAEASRRRDSPERTKESLQDLPAEKPSEPTTMPEDDSPLKKLSRKERKLLAKKKSEAQLEDGPQTPAAPGDEAAAKDATGDPPPLEEGRRGLPVYETREPAVAREATTFAEDGTVQKEDVPQPPEEDPSLKKLSKKERKALAKKKAAEANLRESDAASAEPSEENSRGPAADDVGESTAAAEEAVYPSKDGSRPLDPLTLDDNASPLKKLTKKEQRKLSKKQTAAELDEQPAPEPPKEDVTEPTEAPPASGKPEDAWDMGGSPPAETVTSPTADDDVWHEAVEDVPQAEDGPSKDAPVVQAEEDTEKELPVVLEEEAFAVPSKKKKKKKGAVAVETPVGRSVEEGSQDQLSKDEQPTDQEPKGEVSTDVRRPEEQPTESEPAQPAQEEDISAASTKKGKKNRRKLDAWADSEPPDPTTGEHTNDHTNGHNQAKSGDAGEDPFLAKAGTPGEGAGLPGAAAAVVAASAAVTGTHATDSPSEKTEKPCVSDRTVSPDTEDIPGRDEGTQDVDPDIAPRQVEYVIDPQHGDLLTLPPSHPTSPCGYVDVVGEDLPQLPDSRPDTPPEEAYKRELLNSRRRKSTQDSSHTRSTSETSIPLPLLLGQRSNPSSPRFVRPSPTSSPSSSTADSKKSFPRPISWDGKKDIRPLILPTRQGNESPGRSISHLKDQEHRELDPSPAIGLGLPGDKEHVDPVSGIPAAEERVPCESADRDVPAEEPSQAIEFSTPTKKKGKSKATPDGLARPDSEESAFAPDDGQKPEHTPSGEGAFEMPEVSRNEPTEDIAPTPVDLVESIGPVSKKDITPQDTDKPSDPAPLPSAAAESEKSVDVVLAQETEEIASQPVVEAGGSPEPDTSAVQDEPVMTKAEMKQAKKKKKKKKGPLAGDEPQATVEPEKPADEPSVGTHTARSTEPSADAAAQLPAEPSTEVLPAAPSETGEQSSVSQEALVEAELSPTKSKVGKETKAFPSSGDDASALEPEKHAGEQATETPSELPVEPAPAEPVLESVAEPIATGAGTEIGADLPLSDKSEPLTTERAMTKAEKKKAKKKKNASQSPWDDASTTEPEKASDDKAMEQPTEASIEPEGLADEKPMEEQPIATPAEVEEAAGQKPAEDHPIETPEPPTDTDVGSAPNVADSEELRNSITEPPPDEPAPTTKGKKNKKKKKVSQAMSDVPPAGPNSSGQPIDEKQSETPAESAVDASKGETTDEPSPAEEMHQAPEETAIDSKDEGLPEEVLQPKQAAARDQPQKPTDAKDSGPAEVSSREAPQGDQTSQPVSGKKAKKKKKKGSIWDEPEATTPAVSEEQSSAPFESSEARKDLVPEDTAPADTKEGGDTVGTAIEESLPKELEPVSDKAEVGEKWTDAAEEVGAKDAQATPPLTTGETLPDLSPGPASAKDEESQKSGKKKKKKKVKKVADTEAEEAPQPSETAPPSAESAVPKALGCGDTPDTKGRAELAAPEASEAHNTAPERDDQRGLADPEAPVTDGSALERGGQTDASMSDLSPASVGEKDHSKETTTEPASEPLEQVVEPTLIAPEETALRSSEDVKTEDAPSDQPTPGTEESRDVPEQSAPDTTGAEESSSIVLESAMSGKKSKKKKKSVSFVDLPPELTTDSTVSPMPEKEDDIADVSVDTLAGENREVGRSSNEALASSGPERSEPSSEAGPSSDAPAEESAVHLTSKSKKKKKKKGKAADDPASTSDADASAPPTPVAEPRDFPATRDTVEADSKVKEEPSSTTPGAPYTPTSVDEPATLAVPEGSSESGDVSVAADLSETHATEAVPADAAVPDVLTGADLGEGFVSEKAKITGNESPREGVAESAPDSQGTPPASRELEAQPTSHPLSTTDAEPTDDGSSTPLTKKDKRKKKKGTITGEPEPVSEPAEAVEAEPTVPEPVALEPSESSQPVARGTADAEAARQETTQTDPVDEPASTASSKKDKKKKKKMATPKPEPVSTPIEPIGSEPEPASVDPDVSSASVTEPQPLESNAGHDASETTSETKSEAEKPPDEPALTSATTKKGKEKKGKDASESEPEPRTETTATESISTQAGPLDGLSSTSTGENDKPAADNEVGTVSESAAIENTSVEPLSSEAADPSLGPPAPEPELSSETTSAVPEATETSQAMAEQSEAVDDRSPSASTKKGKKKKKKGKAAAEPISTSEPELVAESGSTGAKHTDPGDTPSAPDTTIDNAAEPSSLEHEPASDPGNSASGETKNLTGTSETVGQDEITSSTPAESVEKRGEMAAPEMGTCSPDKSATGEPVDAEIVSQSETQGAAQTEDDSSATLLSKKAKKKKAKKRDQAAAEPDAVAEPTTAPELELLPVTEPTTGDQPQAEDTLPTSEGEAQTGGTHEVELPSDDKTSEAAPTLSPQVLEETESAGLLSKKGKDTAEPEPEPELVEGTQGPTTPAEPEEPKRESESVEQTQTPETPASTDPALEGPPNLAAKEAAESQGVRDDTLSSTPTSNKKKKKKAKAALQPESPAEPEHESTRAPTPAAEGETAPENVSEPMIAEAVDSAKTQDAQEVPQDDKAVPHGDEPKIAPTVESPMEAEESGPKPTEPTAPSETPEPEPAPAMEEPPVSAETPTPETVPAPEDEPAPRASAQEPTTAEDDQSQTALSKKDKKKKKKAKAKAGADAVQVPEPEAEVATATDDKPASVSVEEPSKLAATGEPGVKDSSPAGDNERKAEAIAKGPVPEPEPTETTTPEELAPTPAKGKKGKKQKKKAKALEGSAQADAEATPTSDDVPKTDSTPALQESAGELSVRSVDMIGSFADPKLQNLPLASKQVPLKNL